MRGSVKRSNIYGTVPHHISQNPLFLIWFGSYTYLLANIWKIWFIMIFGLENNNDNFEEDD